MKVIETRLPGCVVIEPAVFGDVRGYFFETWNAERFAAVGLPDRFVQSNVSTSAQGVLRGLHYQWPRPQGKLVSVVEARCMTWPSTSAAAHRLSASGKRWCSARRTRKQFWIPEGFAHGFAVLSERAVFSYLCTEVYLKDFDAGVRWNDADIAVDWPISAPTLSAKDESAPFLKDIAEDRLPVYVA